MARESRSGLLRWYGSLLGAPLRLLGALMRLYARNRNRVARLASRQSMAGALKALSLITLLLWLLIWVFAGEDQRGRLSDSIRQYWAQIRGEQGEAPP